MQMIEVSKLKPHPRNHEFFDDITGERWADFIKSIVRRGVVEAVVVEEDPITHELIIVSGHQRVKACKEIHILEAPCRIVHYPDFDENTGTPREDMILEDLICTNIMQRGVGNVNPMKMAKCIKELERIYGIRQGSAGKVAVLDGNNFPPNKTQEDLANQIGLDERQLRNYKQLNELIPELQSLVENGVLKSTTAYKIWAKMPQEEQEKFFNEIGKEKIKQMTQKETAKIIQQKQQLEETNKQLEKSFNELSQKYKQEKNNIKTVEVDNTDYSTIEKLKKELESKTKLYNIAKEKEDIYKNQLDLYEKDSQKYKDLTRQIELLTKEKDDIGRAIKSATELSGYIYEIETFLKTKLAPLNYSRSLIDCKDNSVVIKNITEVVECVEKWCMEIREYLPKEQQNIIIDAEVIE